MGETSGYAHSESEYGEARTSMGKSERAIPVMSPQQFMQMDKGELVCFSTDHKPIRLKSMYAKRHPQLMERFGQTLPKPAKISPTAETPNRSTLSNKTNAPENPGTMTRSCFASGRESADERGVGEVAREVAGGMRCHWGYNGRRPIFHCKTMKETTPLIPISCVI